MNKEVPPSQELVKALGTLSAAPQPSPGAQEAVAWGQLGMLNGRSYLRETYDRTPYPPPADVVRNLNLVPLYLHPAPSCALSEEQERSFAEWLNEQRDKPVAEVFHDIVARYRSSRLATKETK